MYVQPLPRSRGIRNPKRGGVRWEKPAPRFPCVMQLKLDSRFACPTEAGDAESSLPHVPRNTAHRIGRIPRREPLPMTDDTPCGQYEKAPGLSSFSLGSGCISWMSPDSETRIPFVCFRDVCGNDGKVFPPGSADHVDLSAAFARSQYQAAMAARVRRIVLNDLPPQDNVTHLLHANHSIRARHLSDSVGKEKQFLPSGSVNEGRDFAQGFQNSRVKPSAGRISPRRRGSHPP
jgi:hypothetical protein